MLATKTNAKEKSPASAKPESKKGVAEEAAPQIQLNPLWHSLATHVDSKTAASASGDPSPIQRKPSRPTGTPHIQRMCAECEEELNADTETPIQTKLTVGSPDDPYEKEADAVADKVMRMPVGGGQDQLQEDAPSIQSKSLKIPPIQRLCAECTEELGGGGTPSVQSKSNSKSAQPSIPNSVIRTIDSPGSGSPLSESVRSRVEPVLGADLSSVRVHTDSQSQLASRNIQAKAFTHGNNIFLGAGQSHHDVKLMAHEATHTVQQGASPASNDKVQKALAHELAHVVQQSGAGNRQINRRAYIQRIGFHDSFTPPTPWYTPRPTSSYTAAERLQEIDDILDDSWVGPLSEARLEVLWGSFGDSLPAMLSQQANMTRWTQSADRGADLEGIPIIRRLISTHFKADVKSLARHYMQVNEEEMRIELEQINARGDITDRPTAYVSTIDQDVRDQIAELQRMAAMAQDAIAAERALRNVKLGTKTSYSSDDYGVMDTQTWDAKFDPQGAPSSGYSFGLGNIIYSPMTGAPSWDEVKAKYDIVKQSQSLLYSDYPAVAALVQRETLGSFVGGNTENARDTLAKSLVDVLVQIARSRSALASDDLDYRDLKPIHQQLLAGAQSASGTSWNDPLPNWALRKEMDNHETSEFWIELGLGSLAAAAFIVAEIATFGGATFFLALGTGLAIGGGMALSKWENYDDLDTANQANVIPGTELVSNAAVRGALINASLESVFFFLDALGPVIRGVRVARTARIGGEVSGEVLEVEGRLAAREAAEEVAEETTGRTAREQVEREAAEEAVERAGRGAFTHLDEGLQWARDAFVLSADILNNLSLAAINRLRSLSADLIQRFRSLTMALKRLALGCASPCRCDLVALRRFLEERASITVANHSPITTVDELIDAIPSGINTTLIRDKLERQPFLMTMIREAGVTVDDMSAMAIRQGIVTGGGNTAAAAKVNFSRFLTSLIPARVGPNRNRFLAIIRATREAEEASLAAGGRASVTNAFQGAMFENYSRLYVSAFRNRNFGRIVFDRSMIPALERASRESDVFVPRLGELWDMKFISGLADPQQVRDYRRILAHEAAQAAPRVRSVNYLFPTREAARNNRHLLANSGFNVYYLSRTGRRLRLR